MMDMVTLMKNAETIGSEDIRRWCDEDPARHTLIRNALNNNLPYFIDDLNINYEYLIEEHEDQFGPFDGWTRTDIFYANGLIAFEAKVFKQWYYSIWPPEETVESHMSRDLAIAVQCSRDLYSGGDLAEKSPTKQNKDIGDWLKKNHPGITGNAYDRIKLIVRHAS